MSRNAHGSPGVQLQWFLWDLLITTVKGPRLSHMQQSEFSQRRCFHTFCCLFVVELLNISSVESQLDFSRNNKGLWTFQKKKMGAKRHFWQLFSGIISRIVPLLKGLGVSVCHLVLWAAARSSYSCQLEACFAPFSCVLFYVNLLNHRKTNRFSMIISQKRF